MNHIPNNYRIRKISDKYFVSAEDGRFAVLDISELQSLKKNKIDSELKNKLENAHIIISKQNIDKIRDVTSKKKCFLFNGTSLHIVVMTLRCNMDCVYCHASSKSKYQNEYDMDKETAFKTIDFIMSSPAKYLAIEFQGGEPLLNWDVLQKTIEYASSHEKSKDKKIEFRLVTNMSCMNDDKMDFLIRNNINICTSLDGPEELHNINRICQEENNHKTVAKWINRINQEYKSRNINNSVNALVTVTKNSLSNPKGIIDEYVKYGIDSIHLRPMNNLGYAQRLWKDISYSAEEFIAFWIEAAGYIEELHKKGIGMTERMIKIMDHKIRQDTDPNYLELRSPCGAVIGQMAYDYNGNIYPCDEARMAESDIFLLGNVKNTEFKDAISCNNACVMINASINDQFICDACAYKPYCGVCPVCNYVEQGSVIAKISQTDRCKILKSQFDWVIKERFL